VVVTKDAKPKVATRQMKEAKFEHAVRQNVYEERQNQLRWQSKLGDEQMTTEDRSKVLADRNKAWNVYKVRTGLHTCAFPSNFLWLPLRLTRCKQWMKGFHTLHLSSYYFSCCVTLSTYIFAPLNLLLQFDKIVIKMEINMILLYVLTFRFDGTIWNS